MRIMKTRILLAVAVGLFFTASAIAAATTNARKVGDSFNYEIVRSVKHAAPPGLPKELIAKFEKNAKIALTLTFSVATDRVDPDGSAHATMSSHFALRGVHMPNPDGSFEGSVLPDGQIVPKYDPNITTAAIEKFHQSTRGHIYSPTAEESSSLAAFRLSDWLSFFNDVALGAGKRKAFKEGDAWRIVVADKNNELVNFSATGKQSYRGHDVVVLAVNSAETTAKGIRTSKGTAYYDPQQSTLIGIHAEMVGDASRNSDSLVENGASGETLDINLQP